MSIQFLLPMGTILGEEPASYRLCGFALAFDRHAKSLASNFNAYSLNWTSEVSCSLLFKFVTKLLEPWEILTQEWELSLFIDIILISTPYLPCKQQVATSNTGPILVFPRIHPFGCDAPSSLGRVYSRQATASVNCENSAVSFVMKYCPISTTFRNPASIQNLLNLSCCDIFSIRSPYCCSRRSLRAKSSQSKSTSVLITLGTNEELNFPPTTGCPDLSRRVSYSSHIFCDCFVKTELIYRSNCAKTVLIVSQSAQ